MIRSSVKLIFCIDDGESQKDRVVSVCVEKCEASRRGADVPVVLVVRGRGSDRVFELQKHVKGAFRQKPY